MSEYTPLADVATDGDGDDDSNIRATSRVTTSNPVLPTPILSPPRTPHQSVCSNRCCCGSFLFTLIIVMSYIFWFITCPKLPQLQCDGDAAACRAINKLNINFWDGGPLTLYEGGSFWGDAVTVQTIVDYANSPNCDADCFDDIHDFVSAIHNRRSSFVVKQLSGNAWPAWKSMDSSYDDPLWWSLLYLDAGITFDNDRLLNSAKDIFDWVFERSWNASPIDCDGGMCWQHEKDTPKNSDCYKNSITNELAFVVASGLHSTENRTAARHSSKHPNHPQGCCHQTIPRARKL